MTAELISRSVKTLCGSRQYSLFDEVVIEEQPESIAPSASGKPFIRFEAPDPRGLSINGKPLGEHLQQAGLTMADIASAITILVLRGLRSPLPARRASAVCDGRHHSLWHPARPEQFARPGLCPVGKRLARSDVGCWWLSGGIMPDHSVIDRFVRQHETLLTTEFSMA